jgi:putative nucleotidyltransferase with HDIG domain
MMSRIAAIAQVADAYNHRSGMRAALKVLKQRSGSWFDPQLVGIVQGWGRDPEWWAQIGGADLTAEVMGEEPEAHARWVTDDDLDVVARAFADIIDAKSPYTYSHSRNVAAYALGIARELRLDADMQRRAYRAGLLHDIGKLGISNTILDKAAPLDATERAAVERHPFYTWEILSRVPAFRDFAWPAALHHERLDGSGYPWHLGGNRLDLIARILGVADVFEALTANRPYRSGLPWEQSWAILSQGRGRAYDGAVLDALAAFRASTSDMTAVAPLAAA